MWSRLCFHTSEEGIVNRLLRTPQIRLPQSQRALCLVQCEHRIEHSPIAGSAPNFSSRCLHRILVVNLFRIKTILIPCPRVRKETRDNMRKISIILRRGSVYRGRAMGMVDRACISWVTPPWEEGVEELWFTVQARLLHTPLA